MIKKLPLIILSLFLFAFCHKESEKPVAQLNIYVCDAPVYIDSMIFQIYSIIFYPDTTDNKIIINWDNPIKINVLDYTNDRDTLIASLSYNSDKIDRIKMKLGKNVKIKINNTTTNLKIKDDTIICVKLKYKYIINNRLVYNFYLDFNTYKSIKIDSKNRIYIEPEIKLLDDSLCGSVKGIIHTKNTLPYLILASKTDTFGTLPLKNGKFYFKHIPENTYSLAVFENFTEQDIIIDSIKVENKKVTGVGTINYFK